MATSDTPCLLPDPPEVGLVDRLARWLEGGDRGTPVSQLLDLDVVVPGALPAIVAFYRDPTRYAIRTGATTDRWSRFVMKVFAALFRQSDVPEREQGFSGYEVCQRLYRDAQGRTHWDRYARVRGAHRRLFIARVGGRPGFMDETFTMWGLPVRLSFEARIEGDAVVMTMRRRRSSLFAWPTKVEYRTAPWNDGLRTQGDFRVPILGVRVRTEFRMKR